MENIIAERISMDVQEAVEENKRQGANMKKKIVLITMLSVFVLLLSGCGSQPEKGQEETGAAESVSRENGSAAAGNTASGNTQAIELEQAKGIAVEHAGLSLEEVTFTKAGQELDDGKNIYDIEFYTDTTEYEYEILADTGDILKYQSEQRDQQGADADSAGSGQSLTEDQAKDAAFQHAGISADKAERVKVELDHEDGVQVYEISFDSGDQEYEYEINARTGEILHYEQETRD